MKDNVTGKVLLEASDQKLVDGVLARQTRAMAKAITLLESARSDHQARAEAVLEALLPATGRSIRVGISGSPGSGKSTFIEALGLYLIGQGHRVAVLAVDPSSSISGGSILGDKTRMERLCQDPNSFIRPSPSRRFARRRGEKTREAMLVCEAAGFDVILVETVGVGQSETTVAGMVDVFVLLQLPNAGDDLQAIKKGIVELADIIVINKADIDPKAAALAKHQFEGALAMLRSTSANWRPPVVTLSARGGNGHRRLLDRDRALPQGDDRERRAAGQAPAPGRRLDVDADRQRPARPVPTTPPGQARPGDDQPRRGRRRPDARPPQLSRLLGFLDGTKPQNST